MLCFQIRIENTSLERIQAIALETRVFIEPPERHLTGRDMDHLNDLFGESSHWADASKPLAWSRATAIVPPFSGSTRFDLELPCSFDFNIAATKYFYGLEESYAPLRFDFTGTIFGERQTEQLAAGIRAKFAMPVTAWVDLMDAYYPHSMWLRLPRQVFQRMNQYKVENHIPTWEDVLERLIPGEEIVQ